jgi:hypothetical protein
MTTTAASFARQTSRRNEARRPLWVISGPAGHTRVWQVCPSKPPLQPSEHRRICRARGGAISDPGRAFIGSKIRPSHEREHCPSLSRMARLGQRNSSRRPNVRTWQKETYERWIRWPVLTPSGRRLCVAAIDATLICAGRIVWCRDATVIAASIVVGTSQEDATKPRHTMLTSRWAIYFRLEATPKRQ